MKKVIITTIAVGVIVISLCVLVMVLRKDNDAEGDSEGGRVERESEGTYEVWNSREAYTNAGLIAAYPRVITIRKNELGKGMQLATFECYKKGIFSKNAALPVFLSNDNGKNWKRISVCEADTSEYTQFFQPCLYELERDWGKYGVGTILLAGTLCTDYSTEIVLYASTDSGQSWELCGVIDKGGAPIYNPGENSTTTPVWEPELIQLDDGSVVCYYSDEGYKSDKILQAIVYKVCKDGKNWGNETMVVGIPDKMRRPGMWSMLRLDDGRYFACYEMVNEADMPAYYRISEDGLNWGNAADYGSKIVDEYGNSIKGSPYCLYDNHEGKIYISGKHYGKTTNDEGYYLTTTDINNFVWKRENMLTKYTASDSVNEAYSQSMCLDRWGTSILRLINQLDEEGNVCIECNIENIH